MNTKWCLPIHPGEYLVSGIAFQVHFGEMLGLIKILLSPAPAAPGITSKASCSWSNGSFRRPLTGVTYGSLTLFSIEFYSMRPHIHHQVPLMARTEKQRFLLSAFWLPHENTGSASPALLDADQEFWRRQGQSSVQMGSQNCSTVLFR